MPQRTLERFTETTCPLLSPEGTMCSWNDDNILIHFLEEHHEQCAENVKMIQIDLMNNFECCNVLSESGKHVLIQVTYVKDKEITVSLEAPSVDMFISTATCQEMAEPRCARKSRNLLTFFLNCKFVTYQQRA